MRPLLIADSNIWIDLSNGGLMRQFFGLPFRLGLADVAFHELKSVDRPALLRSGLAVLRLDATGVSEAAELGRRYRGPRRADLFALVLCKREGCGLLTGDKALRYAAASEGVEVRGILWVLDELVGRGVIDGPRAARALKDIWQAGARLPAEQVRHRLRCWRT